MTEPSHKVMKKQYYWGYALVLGSLLATFGIYFGSLWAYGTTYHYGLKYLAKIGSLGATTLICWAFLLSTRIQAIDSLFGGLDKAYQAHRRLGESAVVLVLLHPICLALDPQVDFFSFLWFSEDPVRNSGLIGLFSIAILVAISVWRVLPYHVWRWTHSLLGLVFIGLLYHGFIAEGEVRTHLPLTIWFGFLCTVALLSFLYIRLLYRWFGPLYDYVVHEVTEQGDFVEILLRPLRPLRRLEYRPGQFVYVQFENEELAPEPHPFSISSPTQEAMIRLSIKELGDWTAQLGALKEGDRAKIWGPYGRFGEHAFDYDEHRAVLVAGGIGITPLLSMAGDRRLQEQHRPKISLVYSVVSEDEALYLDELRELESQLGKDRFELVVHETGEGDDEEYLTAERLDEYVGPLNECVYLICGPTPMMDSLKAQLQEAGVPFERIFAEDFSIV